jgi:hypothetical protein
MRKQLKRKKRSCALCKPHKVGWEKRWKPRDAAKLRRFEWGKRRGEYDEV